MKKGIFLLLAFVLILSCSKDDSSNSINQDGGDVFRYQVVFVDLPNVNLDQTEYQALFDGQNITLSKSDEHKLFFLVPNSTTLGEQDLLISSLNDVRIHYDVQETVLTETVEVTMEPFFANLESFSQNLDTSPEAVDAQNALDSFNNYYSITTLANKTELAILYKANKIMFDRVLQNVNITGKTSISNAECFGAAVIGMGASIPLLLAPTGATQIAGVVLGAASIYYAIKCGKPLWNEYVLASFINVNGILGTNQKSALVSFVAFSNDVSSTLSLNTVNRKLISSDSSRTESIWVYFFPYFDLLNVNIAKINDVIPVVNNFPFVNFPLIPQIQLPASSPEVNTIVNQSIFSKIQFSVIHPNLQLVSSTLQSDGQLKMKIKIVGTPTSLPVESFLNYSYNDEFSTFSGKLPIRVKDELQVGDNHDGGIIAYILQPADPGYVPGEIHGLIMAQTNQSSGIKWMSVTSTIATSSALGSGNQNTINIISNPSSNFTAAALCYNLVLNGFEDWYLPSRNELEKIYFNKTILGGVGSGEFWSSTGEISSLNNYAYCVNFSNNIGFQTTLEIASFTYQVRAVRTF